MSDLALDGVSKRFGDHLAVDSADLAVAPGSFVCLLGPSGCGKTTLLRIVAGLEAASSGSVRFEGEAIDDRPVHDRGFGMVFQSLALFPHLSVADNIAYPLRLRGQGRSARAARVAELLELVQLSGAGDRAVSRLSGGQRQRVAIARALAVSPRLFLLDEPLSALDAKLREAMQVELRQLQERLAITTILVTHDRREAMTMADTLVVMKDGRIQQTGRPIDLYRHPATPFVADFLGHANFLSARATEAGAEIGGWQTRGLSLGGASAATVSIRPEDVVLRPEGGDGLAGRVTFVRELGSEVEVTVETAAGPVVAHHPRGSAPPGAGTPVAVGFDPEAATVFPETEAP